MKDNTRILDLMKQSRQETYVYSLIIPAIEGQDDFNIKMIIIYLLDMLKARIKDKS